MPHKFPDRDDDYLPVMVPSSGKRLVPLAPERVERLRRHLREALLDLRKARRLDRFAAPVSPEPAGFSATVAGACSLCKGWCCRNGGDEAFLDDRTLARLRLTNPKITEQAIELVYLARMPDAAYHDSCIFAARSIWTSLTAVATGAVATFRRSASCMSVSLVRSAGRCYWAPTLDQIEALWTRMWWKLHYGGRGGSVSLAVSACDIALHDLKARRLGGAAVADAGRL